MEVRNVFDTLLFISGGRGNALPSLVVEAMLFHLWW
jgi:hypothetical protein